MFLSFIRDGERRPWAAPKEIKKAYRILARKYHPDLNPGDKAAEQHFKEIKETFSASPNYFSFISKQSRQAG